MVTLSHTSQAALKAKLQDVDVIETYTYFPDIFTAGKKKLDIDEFDFLLKNGLVKIYRTDTCGRILKLTQKGKKFIKE